MKHRRARIGDVFEIPLPDGRRAYGQYVFRHEKMGPLVQVFDLVAEDEAHLEQIKGARPLFPPVFTGLFAAIRTGLWRIIGHMVIGAFAFPKFISPFYDSKVGKVRRWFLWNGDKYENVGRTLPEELRELEQLVGWDPNDIANRIITGETPLDFRLDR